MPDAAQPSLTVHGQADRLHPRRADRAAGGGQDSDRRKTRAAGFLHHLVKPVDFDAVEATLVALEGGTPTRPGLP